jgi:hypothetical protein
VESPETSANGKSGGKESPEEANSYVDDRQIFAALLLALKRYYLVPNSSKAPWLWSSIGTMLGG